MSKKEENLKEYECECISQQWAKGMVDHVFDDHTKYPEKVKHLYEIYIKSCKALVGKPISEAKNILRIKFGTLIEI